MLAAGESREIREVQRRSVVDEAVSVDVAVEQSPLWQAVRALPDRQRAAIVLRYVDDLSVHEIALVLDVAEGTIKASLSQAGLRWRVAWPSRSRSMLMDELDDRMHAEAADLRARAAALAQTETALRELRAASGGRPRPPWVPRAVATATIAAAVLVGFVILRQNDNSRSVSSATETAPTTAVALTTTTAPAEPTTEPVSTVEATTDATLSTSTPFTRCDYTDPGKYPSNRDCPEGTDVDVPISVAPVDPLVVGEPSSTTPEAIVSGEVAIVGQCVYLIDSAAGATA